MREIRGNERKLYMAHTWTWGWVGYVGTWVVRSRAGNKKRDTSHMKWGKCYGYGWLLWFIYLF